MGKYRNGKGSDSLVGRSTYEALLAEFREHPGNVSRAGRAAGVARGTARRAWHEGWPSRQLPAIRDVLDEERLLARSRRQAAVYLAGSAEAGLPPGTSDSGGGDAGEDLAGPPLAGLRTTGVEAARMLAKDDAVAAREAEASMVKLSRANTVALMSATARLLSAGIEKSRELETKLRTGAVKLEPAQVTRFVSTLAYLTRNAAEAAKINLEMERIILGEPTEIVGVDVRNMGLEDAARTIELASRALARARKRGLVPDAVVDLAEVPADPAKLH